MPFLELDQGLDGMTAESGFTTSGLATSSLTAPKPQIDIQALHNYCSDHTKFPSEALKSAQASEEATDFVQRLLAASPKGRPTATEALQDRWLVGGRWRNDWYDRLESEFSALGVNLDLQDDEKGILILRPHETDIMQFLPISAEAGLSTLLEHAVAKGLNSAVSMLLESPKSRSLSKSNTRKFFQLAVENRRIETMELLLDNKAEINALVDGETALQGVSGRGDIEMARILLEKGVDVNAKAST